MSTEVTEVLPSWADMAVGVVVRLAEAGDDFSSDDVWEALAELQVPAPAEPRALGPIMHRMIATKLITPIGFAVSRRRRGGTVRVYGFAAPAIKVVKAQKRVASCELCDVNHNHDHRCSYCGREARLLSRVEDSTRPSMWQSAPAR